MSEVDYVNTCSLTNILRTFEQNKDEISLFLLKRVKFDILSHLYDVKLFVYTHQLYCP